MRRFSILALALCAVCLLALAWPAVASAAEGDPDDHCSYSPDYPFGWSFNAACERHDTCIDELPPGTTLLERLDCDEEFLSNLLSASHATLEGICEGSRLCSLLATIYYRVVRVVTLVTWGAVDVRTPAPLG